MTGTPTDTLPAFLDAIERDLLRPRWEFLDEATMHEDVGRILSDYDWGDEWVLPGAGRVDFFHVERGVAVELKCDGNPTAVAAQLVRYADHADVRAVVLVTSKARLGHGLPKVLRGKPLRVVNLGRSVF